MLGRRGGNPFIKQKWDRGTPEFSRITNLSDGVFAIVMTLLVLTIDAPDVPAGQLAAELRQGLPQIIIFVLSFALVASIWWHHHRFVEMLASLDPGLIGMNLVLLGMVALVPFLTNLVGNNPTARAAVLPFIGLFALLSIMYLIMVVRARSVDAWRRPMTLWAFYREVGKWASSIAVIVVASAIALRWPVAGLAILGATIVFGPLATRLAYRE